LALTALAASLFLWPALLQIEKLAPRIESLKVLGQAGAGGGHGGHTGKGGAQPPGYRRGGLVAPAPNLGALREGPANRLEALAPPATTADVGAQDFVPPFDFGPTGPSQGGPDVPFSLPRPRPVDSGLFVVGPGGGPVTNPPVTDPGGPNPPVTNPPVTNPPVDPGTPPPPGPPDTHPPVVPPPVGPTPVTDPGPPVLGPGGTFTPPDDPGGPGPGPDPRGGNPPIPGVPEPAVWLQLVLGAGLAGAALRRARANRHSAASRPGA
jgi:hypothetical protein